jgi:hypothetical protein
MTEKITCPKCGYLHTYSDDPNIPKTQCPSCGIFYFKYLNQRIASERGSRNTPKKTNQPRKQVDNGKTQPAVNPSDTPRPAPTDTERLLAYQELSTLKTNHILHLLLSVLTMGLWLIPWLIVTANYNGERNKIRKKYGLPTESDASGNIIKIFMIIFLITIFARGCIGP